MLANKYDNKIIIAKMLYEEIIKKEYHPKNLKHHSGHFLAIISFVILFVIFHVIIVISITIMCHNFLLSCFVIISLFYTKNVTQLFQNGDGYHCMANK